MKSSSYHLVDMLKGSMLNHERHHNLSLPQNWQSFKLFWTSPGKKSYYGRSYLTHKFKTTKDMIGIYLDTSPSDMELEFPELKDYGESLKTSDSFRNLWYAILEDNLIGDIDFINLYDEEIIISYKNLCYLKKVS